MYVMYVLSHEREKIAAKYTRTYWPLTGTATWWLLLDRLGAPGWVYGVFWTLAAIFFMIASYGIFTQRGRAPVWRDGEKVL